MLIEVQRTIKSYSDRTEPDTKILKRIQYKQVHHKWKRS